MKYRLRAMVHPLFHKRGQTEACWICEWTWRDLERDPQFIEDLRQGEADIKAGRLHKWSDIRRELE